ncbi:serine O-acetyltransferase [Gluconobacter wancherniae]|uniref:Serine acetyltransferase n=1 Tax=Gluconobacter wancherniae NBRC 103581 TaxID=656744 RepID=A0A511B0L3_9PROT|nr:serine O-acetyltransferase [Gluconobacter wancherniae]MBF0854173.1 serine O-acetyltransferase [Gluconobacter wancherniae]MBS1062565.1 serine O-acetyltransferase [Gluconobacter wancherniae]MBS1088698.1 serine O-acetyltransferase [Gluconobacter wancherniae]MBS1094703.1 serine O-acetyltransferase [Gluconobacter wancherniae]GBD57229.1 serine O-acetyltransferase [Gluconobacter wancherniae NBRC 103581]
MNTTPDLKALWTEMQSQACACHDPLIQDVFATNIGDHPDFQSALSSLLGTKLADRSIPAAALTRLVASCMSENPGIAEAAAEDILATYDRDPACQDLVTPFLFFKGWHAVQAHRIAFHLWHQGRRPLAYHLQSRMNELFAIDIHPAARLGRRLTIDHGTGIVIGETAIVEDDVSLFQDVTLGGTGKLTGDRHPIVRRGVMIGSGAKILGRLEIGAGARIGAASVVLEDVPPNVTVVGNPARLVGSPRIPQAAT